MFHRDGTAGDAFAGGQDEDTLSDRLGPFRSAVFYQDLVSEDRLRFPTQKRHIARIIRIRKGDRQAAGAGVAVFFDRASGTGRENNRQRGGKKDSFHNGFRSFRGL